MCDTYHLFASMAESTVFFRPGLYIALKVFEMKDSIRIYHNPRCSKSRMSLELLHEKGIEADVVEYLKTPPGKQELNELLDLLKLEPRQLMRTHESEYKDNHLDNDALTRDQLVDAMVKFPKLIERPIVVANGKAAIGRPPENILEIL